MSSKMSTKWRLFRHGLNVFEWCWCSVTSLQWRHDEHDGVSNHQPYECLLNRLFRRRSKKTSKLRVTGLCKGKSPVTGEFPTQRARNAENIFIGGVIMLLWWIDTGSPLLLHVVYHSNRQLLGLNMKFQCSGKVLHDVFPGIYFIIINFGCVVHDQTQLFQHANMSWDVATI